MSPPQASVGVWQGLVDPSFPSFPPVVVAQEWEEVIKASFKPEIICDGTSWMTVQLIYLVAPIHRVLMIPRPVRRLLGGAGLVRARRPCRSQRLPGARACLWHRRAPHHPALFQVRSSKAARIDCMHRLPSETVCACWGPRAGSPAPVTALPADRSAGPFVLPSGAASA